MPYLMNLDRNSSPIVENADLALLSVDRDLDSIHILVPLFVVRCIDENLVEDLVKTRHVTDISCLHRVQFGVVYPHLLFSPFDGANVCIWSFDDVFQLG